MAGLLQSLNKQNFGPDDSMIASAVRHPLTGLLKAKEWLEAQMNTGMGMPYPQDEGSIYQYAPLDMARHEAALNIAGLAETGSIPFAPKSRGGILGTVARKADDLPETEFSKAHKIAQKNAALPIEQGGLGLPPDNTAMDRAAAMGFDTDAYHQTDAEDITRFLNKRLGANTVGNASSKSLEDTSKLGHWFGAEPLSKSTKNHNFPGNITYPVMLKSESMDQLKYIDDLANKIDRYGLKNYKKLLKEDGIDSIMINNDFETGLPSIVAMNPKNIRSRFAAFDPMKKNSSNLLASGLLGSLVLNDYARDK